MSLALKLESQEEIDALADHFKKKKLKTPEQRVEDLVVATDGYTYSLSQLLRLKKDEIEDLNINFFVKKANKKLQLKTVVTEIKKDSTFKKQLIHNKALCQALESLDFDCAKTPTSPLPKDEFFPFISPVILPDECSCDYAYIKSWLLKSKTCPFDRHEVCDDQVFENKSLENVLWLHYEKQQPDEVKEIVNDELQKFDTSDLIKKAPYLRNLDLQQVRIMDTQVGSDRYEEKVAYQNRARKIRTLATCFFLISITCLFVFMPPLGILSTLGFVFGGIAAISVLTILPNKINTWIHNSRNAAFDVKQQYIYEYQATLASSGERVERLKTHKAKMDAVAVKSQPKAPEVKKSFFERLRLPFFHYSAPVTKVSNTNLTSQPRFR